jgi:hypothetical protein
MIESQASTGIRCPRAPSLQAVHEHVVDIVRDCSPLT